MKHTKKLALLALIAAPALIYTPTTTLAAEPTTIVADSASVYNVIQLISTINNAAATFQTSLDAALKAYNALNEVDKQAVTNYSTLSAHQQTRLSYKKLAAQIEEKLASVPATAVNYYQNVLDTRDWYNTLNAAQKSFVSTATQKLLTSALTPNTTVDQVTSKIKLLNSSRSTFHQDVATVRAELNALRKANPYISFPTNTEALLIEAEQLVVRDKSAAQNVEKMIKALSPKTASKMDVQAAKTAFEALTPTQQQLVSNVWTLADYVKGNFTLPTTKADNSTPTLSSSAAKPGKTTAMGKTKNTYTAQINVADTEDNSKRFVLTTKSNMTLIVPPLNALLNEDSGVMEISLSKVGNRIKFHATLNKKLVEFDTAISLIIEDLPKSVKIVRINEFGMQETVPYTIDGDRYTVETTTSGTFQLIYN
ncbi:hypothetical protein [Lysinibacillus piscis]|uniref:SbsC C-terminal domain-containing protein n=1 Tax=Lysinibacillus piscis TaxID=2518931 RepID=A0ABQ5NP82_9BACI|nr:hypothetical protein [Lysinibacillus sp. KH24]GLC90144.1 hypothetical protein LYSBPC_32710 [Lysinibacillus sp. KH24]